MTVSRKKHKVKGDRRARRRKTFWADFTAALATAVELDGSIQWPSDKYRWDIPGFARDILGIELWSKQREIAEAFVHGKPLAVASGHKVGKSTLICVIALWFYCTFPRARVVLTSTTSRQVDTILWRELRMLLATAGRCVACRKLAKTAQVPRVCEHSAAIQEEPAALARTGLKSADFREVWGFTAKEADAAAGVSGENMLIIADEASGIPKVVFEATRGNRMGGAWFAMFGNPVHNEGEFFDAFHSKSEFFTTFTISSEETPNYVERRRVIPGLATYEEVELAKAELDEGQVSIRIHGRFALGEELRIFSLGLLNTAQLRHTDADNPDDPPAERAKRRALIDGQRLWIGLDPAGESGEGDESALAPRRGQHVYHVHTRKGLTPEEHVDWVKDTIAELGRVDDLKPVVIVDKGGKVGSRVFKALIEERDLSGAFEVVGVDSSDDPARDAKHYVRMRDLLTANLFLWIRDGGAIPNDTKLEHEAHLWEWRVMADGKRKLTPDKYGSDGVRRRLGRSCDRYDAVALSVWEPKWLSEVQTKDRQTRRKPDGKTRVVERREPAKGLDPFSGALDPFA